MLPGKKTNTVYKFECICSKSYIGTSKRYLKTRMDEHYSNPMSNVYLHYNECSHYHKSVLESIDHTENKSQIKKAKKRFFSERFSIMCTERNYRMRKLMEALLIKINHPQINDQKDSNTAFHHLV